MTMRHVMLGVNNATNMRQWQWAEYVHDIQSLLEAESSVQVHAGPWFSVPVADEQQAVWLLDVLDGDGDGVSECVQSGLVVLAEKYQQVRLLWADVDLGVIRPDNIAACRGEW